ncbi:MAG: MATE family efflux transporter, partial [Roseburia sp.]|nr:MATE family efflux transporter [Roseburia sp.]
TIITFLFDSCFIWCITIPLAYCLSRFTSIPIFPLYLIVSGVDVLKSMLGYLLLVKGIWLNNLVEEKK